MRLQLAKSSVQIRSLTCEFFFSFLGGFKWSYARAGSFELVSDAPTGGCATSTLSFKHFALRGPHDASGTDCEAVAAVFSVARLTVSMGKRVFAQQQQTHTSLPVGFPCKALEAWFPVVVVLPMLSRVYKLWRRSLTSGTAGPANTMRPAQEGEFHV